MPVSEKLAAQVVQIQENFALLSKWIEGLDSLLDVELIEVHLNTLKDILDVIGISGGLVFRKDGEGRRDSIGRRASMNNKREDVLKSYARSLSTILHLCSNKIAKMETTLANSESGSPEAKQMEKLITSVKLYFETGLPPVAMMNATNKKERRKSITSPTEKHVKLNNMRRKGMLLIDSKSALFSNSLKPRWIILDDKKLHIFKDETTSAVYKELPLDAITSISSAKLGKYEFGFHIGCADGTVLSVAASDKAQMAVWMLAIDGTKHNFSFNSSMDPTEKASLLRYHSFEGRKGGHVKSNHPGGGEQDWSYFKEGELGVSEGEEKQGLSFKWNGELLHAFKKQAQGESVNSCLTARWNGITLAYYFLPNNLLRITTKQPIFIPTPIATYSWYEHDREYRPVEGSRVPIYKWTRHFLVEKNAPSGTGEWIVEGDIPEPLVMTLQLYHYHKTTTPNILPTEDINVNKSLTRSKSSSFSFPIPIPNQEAFAIFNKHVPPGKDKLAFNNFVTLMHEMKPGLSEPEIKLAFELVDVSKDGCVDLQEFSTWFSELKEWGND